MTHDNGLQRNTREVVVRPLACQKELVVEKLRDFHQPRYIALATPQCTIDRLAEHCALSYVCQTSGL
jgi:hypothetical protein